jgi:hypothetical protein
MKQVLKLFLIFFLAIIFNSCEEIFNEGKVTYEVTCYPSDFSITYENSSGNTEQQTIRSSNWSTSFTAKSGDFVYISAQAENENADVHVSIKYKGDIIEQASSSGDYVIATASGSIP